MVSKVTSNGRLTIPQALRHALGLVPGSSEFRRAADGSIVIQKADGAKLRQRLEDVIGCAGPVLSTDEIMALTRGE